MQVWRVHTLNPAVEPREMHDLIVPLQFHGYGTCSETKMKLPLMALLLLIWPFSSGKEYHMTAGNIVPAANGTVKVQKDLDGNSRLDIKVSKLADPARLTPSENKYVVWIRPNDGKPQKQGALSVSNHSNGELQMIATSKDCEVFITAEPSESVSAPPGPEVLRTHISLG